MMCVQQSFPSCKWLCLCNSYRCRGPNPWLLFPFNEFPDSVDKEVYFLRGVYRLKQLSVKWPIQRQFLDHSSLALLHRAYETHVEFLTRQNLLVLQDFKESGHRSKFGVDDVFADAVEYGIMLECPTDECTDLKRPTTKQTYWAVG